MDVIDAGQERYEIIGTSNLIIIILVVVVDSYFCPVRSCFTHIYLRLLSRISCGEEGGEEKMRRLGTGESERMTWMETTENSQL